MSESGMDFNAGLEQRWLFIHSQAAEARAHKTVSKQVLKQSTKEQKAFAKLCRQHFACQTDAQAALKTFQDSLKVLTLHNSEVIERRHYKTSGRPAKDPAAHRLSYQLHASLAAPIHLFQEHLKQAASFVLASNELDLTQLSDLDILTTYRSVGL